MTTNEEILGRADANDLEAILAITNDDMNSVIHAVKDNADAIFTWDYEKGQRPALNKLYEKAKTSQWNGQTDLPWDLDVDIEKVVAQTPIDPDNDPVMIAARAPGAPLASWGDDEFTHLKMEMQNWTLSQFMHGEQGALLCTAKIVETVPWIDAKYYASTQVMDEARHVAFGVLSLKEYYEGLTDAEMLERQQFTFEAAVRMRDRFLQQEVWERMGVDVRTMVKLQLEHEGNKNDDPFQQLLFSKIVPNCKKLGLLDRNDHWLRKKFAEINVIQFEDWTDTGEEYLLLDELGKDRAAAEAAAAG